MQVPDNYEDILKSNAEAAIEFLEQQEPQDLEAIQLQKDKITALSSHGDASYETALQAIKAQREKLAVPKRNRSTSGISLNHDTMPGKDTTFFCATHADVKPFRLNELHTQVFDTYAICAALLTTMSAARFFFDNRDPSEFLFGKGIGTTVHLSYLMQHIHLLVAVICTSCGLEALMIFVLCAMYARSALALPGIGGNVFEYFLKKSAQQRIQAFGFLLAAGILSSLNLVVHCLSFPVFVSKTDVPAVILDVAALGAGITVLVICVITFKEASKVVFAARIIFSDPDKLEEFEQEHFPLLHPQVSADPENGQVDMGDHMTNSHTLGNVKNGANVIDFIARRAPSK